MKKPAERPSKDTDSLTVEAMARGRQAGPEPAPAPTPGFEAEIILIAHPDEQQIGSHFRLTPGDTLEIGRSSECGISLPEVPSVSRRHARLRHAGAHVTVEDLSSTNGTLLNDTYLQEPTMLKSGDRFQVGAVHFKFLHDKDVERAYHDALHHLVMRDGLTDIYNRRKYHEEAAREFARARRHDRPLTLVLFDIDEFKALNDERGHPGGDAALVHLAGIISKEVRAEQLFSRVGGDEFAVLCPETNLEGGTTLAHRLQKLLEENPARFKAAPLPFTCSFGVAQASSEMKEPEDLFQAADRALYQAKSEGRDRVVVANPGFTSTLKLPASD